MKRKIYTVLLLTVLVLVSVQAIFAEDDIPARMRVGVVGKCGDMFEFRLAAVPSLSSGIAGYKSQSDLHYLILRVGIKNLTGDTVSLDKRSFQVTEYYNNTLYGTYYLDKAFTYYSAYIGNTQLTFDDPIAPGEERPTTLVFQVYPDVTSWVFTFNPVYPNQGSRNCELRFSLPMAERNN